MEINKLSKNVYLLASTRFLEFFAGLIRIKLAATLLGTKGLGVLEQLTFFSQQMATFSLMSLSEGWVKQIAEREDDTDIQNLLCTTIKSYLLLITVIFTVILFLLLVMASSFSLYVFGESQYLYVYYAAILCLPILIINSIPFSILKAFKSVQEIAKARVIITAINVCMLVPMMLIWRLDGAVGYVIVSYIITFSVNFHFARVSYLSKYNISLSKIFMAKISQRYLKELLFFSVYGVSVGLFSIISELIVRSVVVDALGIEAIGLYSPVIMWASMLTGIVLPSFTTYLYPRFCELETSSEVVSLINDGLRLGTFVLIPFIFFAIPFKYLFISIFYSSEFMESARYLPGHFLGLIFYVWWFVFSQSLTPTGRIKEHGIMMILFYATNILIVTSLISAIGLYAYMAKFLIAPLVFFLIYFFYCRSSMGFKFFSHNIKLMLYLLFGTIGLVWIDMLSGYHKITFIVGPLMTMGTYFFLNSKEKVYVANKVLQVKYK